MSEAFLRLTTHLNGLGSEAEAENDVSRDWF